MAECEPYLNAFPCVRSTSQRIILIDAAYLRHDILRPSHDQGGPELRELRHGRHHADALRGELARGGEHQRPSGRQRARLLLRAGSEGGAPPAALEDALHDWQEERRRLAALGKSQKQNVSACKRGWHEFTNVAFFDQKSYWAKTHFR